MEFEAVDEGTIGKIMIEEGTEGVKVNSPIAVLLEEGEDADPTSTTRRRADRPMPPPPRRRPTPSRRRGYGREAGRRTTAPALHAETSGGRRSPPAK